MKLINEHYRLQEISMEIHNIRKEYDSNLTVSEKRELEKIESRLGDLISSLHRTEPHHKDLMHYSILDDEEQRWWVVEHKRVKGAVGTSLSLVEAYRNFEDNFKVHLEFIKYHDKDCWETIKGDVEKWLD